MRERGRADGFRTHGRRTVRSRERSRYKGRNQHGYEKGPSLQNRPRKLDIWGYDRQVYNQATVFFFTNFPEDWSYENMWQTFRKYGRVLAIYSPLRKSKIGSRFGFVRFLEVKNERELEQQLDQIRVGNFKLWVNRPKFRKDESHTNAMQKNGGKESMRTQRTYAEVVKGNRDNGTKKESWNVSEDGNNQGQLQRRDWRRTPIHVWRPKNKGQEKDVMEFNVNEEDYSWLEGCYVGTANSVEIIPTLQEKFFMEGYFSCKVRAMGGRLVLLEGGDKEEIKDLVELAPEWMGQWFKDIKPWNPSMVANERFVWIRCQGVPVHAWGVDFFATIGATWGKFISLDDSTSKKQRFDIGRMLISTPVMDFISDAMNIKVNGKPYKIKIMEEEATNGIFSMKSDHVFQELSDSDDTCSESWSLDSKNDREVGGSGTDDGFGGNYSVADGKKEDDDVEMYVEGSVRQTSNRWCDERNRKKREQNSAVIDMLINAGGSLGEREASEDGKIQISSTDNQNGMTAALETVPDSIETQPKQKKEGQRYNEEDESCGLRNPTIGKEKGAEEVSRPKQGPNPEPVVNGPHSLEHEEVAENEDAAKGIIVENVQEHNRNSNCSINFQSENEEYSFWKGFESESGKEQEWMGRKQEKTKKRRKKKTKLCLLVYKKDRQEGRTAKLEGRKQPTKEQKLEEMIPEFCPGTQNQVAGESITDSGIANRNEEWRRLTQIHNAEKIWAFAKKIGVGDYGNEAEIIQRLQSMEDRDKENFRKVQVSMDDRVGNGCINL